LCRCRFRGSLTSLNGSLNSSNHGFGLGCGRRMRRLYRSSFVNVFNRRLGSVSGARSIFAFDQAALDLYRHRFIDRAGVGFLFCDAQYREQVEDHVGLDFKLASQLIDADFDHTVCPVIHLRHRGCLLQPCSFSKVSAPAGDCAVSIVTDCSCCSCGSAAVSTASGAAVSASPPDSNWP